MKQLSEKIAKYVIKTGVVSPELYVVYQYGFQIGLEMLCCFVTCLSIAIYMHEALDMFPQTDEVKKRAVQTSQRMWRRYVYCPNSTKRSIM